MKIRLIFTVLISTLLFSGSNARATFGLYSRRLSTEARLQYRLCVPDAQLPLCQQMVISRQYLSKIQCVPAPDKISCLDRIIKGDADWMIVDPEELYVSHRYLPDGVVVTSEVRSWEYSTRDHRYAPVVVTRKSSGIDKISDLRGKRSCHTGFGKTAGWRVPFSHLLTMGQLKCSNATLDAVEHDIETAAEYFGPTCAPGQWTPDKDGDKSLKNKYPQLCELCASPDSCSKKDNYAGYDGALKCLTENDGDVAWTKWDAVRDFFRLNQSTPLDITADYEVLCRDGSKMPLTSDNPCGWAKRPWRTVILTNRLAKSPALVTRLQKEITAFRIKAQNATEVPQWLTKVLDFEKNTDVEYHFAPELVKTFAANAYLRPSNYSETIWHPSCGIHEKPLRICVVNQMEVEKCDDLKLAAIGERISPGFSCVMGYSAHNCAQLVSKGDADLMIASAELAEKIQSSSRLPTKLVSILRTLEPTGDEAGATPVPYHYALTVIRSDIADSFKGSLAALKGKCACHDNNNKLIGWNAPMQVLREAGELTGENCDISKEFSTYCNQVPEEDSSSSGPLACLTDDVADVAFVDHVALLEKIRVSKSALEPLTDLQLLCRNGTVTSLDNYRECHWGLVPTQKVLVRAGSGLRDGLISENSRLSLLKAQELFSPGGKMEGIMKLFGPYYGTSDLIFQDSSVGLQNELGLQERERENKLIRDFSYCHQPEKGYHSV